MNRRQSLPVAVAGLALVLACTLPDIEPPRLGFITPLPNAILTPGQVPVRVLVFDDQTLDRVDFYDNSSLIGSDRTVDDDTFGIAWNAALGDHRIKAIAWDKSAKADSDFVDVEVR